MPAPLIRSILSLALLVSLGTRIDPAYSASCGEGTLLLGGAGAGSVSSTEPYDWWEYTAVPARHTILLSPATGDADLYIFDESCTPVCTSSLSGSVTDRCDVDVSTLSTLNIAVHWWSGDNVPYTLNASPSPSASARPLPCDDGIDNDHDGTVDYGDDGGCTSSLDPSEDDDSCRTIADVTACLALTALREKETFTVYSLAMEVEEVAAYVDLYDFMLPNGGVVTVPCVVTTGVGTDACATAGGSFARRAAALVQRSLQVPTGGFGAPMASATVCDAHLEVTVESVGVRSFPLYTLC